jgi:hydrogenase maturation protein HypF
VCGPKIWLVDPGGNPIEEDSAIRTAASMVRQGRIVAVKGIGGFHFAVDATNGSAVARLRELKARGDKPFALMAETVADIRRFAEVSPEEEVELRTLARPIVLLKKRNEGYGGPGGIVPDVSPSNTMIGVMLPYAPLHFLLFGEGLGVLVMTSANRKGDPVFCDNDDALDHLAGMADAFLLHDRGIHIRSDDSVGRMIDGRFRLIRRARGYAPHPIGLTGPAPDILATGGSMKNTVCVIKDRSAFMGPHIGDLENPAGFRFFHEAAAHMQALFDVNPEAVVHDLHPDFVSRGLAGPGEKIDAQHHHAHIVSCMVENGCEGDVIGFAFDGTGYGEDGAVWGGEVLLASHARYTRAAYVEYVAMPGGAAAVNEPWRMGISWLHHTFGPAMESLDIPLLNGGGVGSDPETNRTLVRMIEKRFNAPLTSSMGRLFDAVAAIMGLCRVNSFDGQAAMMLEMCATGDEPGYDVGPVQLPDGGGAVDMRPLIRAVVRDLESRAEPGVIAARFHSTLIGMFTGIGEELARKTGIRTAALSGGVFQNARLLTGLTHALAEKGFTVLTQAQVPSNDGGLSLGQAGIAAALCRERKNHDV